jgi:membrane fusion protein
VGSLFRPEVIANRQRDWLGSIQLIRPVSLSVITGFVVLAAVAVTLFLALGEYTRRAHVSGYLVLAAPPTPALVPAGTQLQAYLFAPASAVGALHENQAVQMRYSAFAPQSVGDQTGVVTHVSRLPAPTAELSALPAPLVARGEPLYRVVVTLDRQTIAVHGEAKPLVAGMQLQADVALERRRLIGWLFAPLFDAARRV